LESAAKLEAHLQNLASLPASPARDTIIVCDAGFTGIELATELPRRLGAIPNAQIVLVERADTIGPDLGPGPRPVIEKALQDLGIHVRLSSTVMDIDAKGVVLASGERIEATTIVWTAGMRATPLTHQVPGHKDPRSGRLVVDSNLRVPLNDRVFATGDTAYAVAAGDAESGPHYALMSCQHAIVLGRVSGHNTVAEFIGNEPLMTYAQPACNCCLDLGPCGALVGAGWKREVKMKGDLAKRVKNYINGTLIYPPKTSKEAIMAANPIVPDSDELFEQILQAVL
jgi:NADH dehydrogenase FAD-containing subunit